MVPGMAERERLATETRRAEWLNEASPGPARITYAPARAMTGSGALIALQPGIWRRGLSVARILGRRVHLLRLGVVAGRSGWAKVRAG